MFYVPSLVLILVLIISVFVPQKLAQPKFIPVHQALLVKTNKKFPPYVAYNETLNNVRPNESKIALSQIEISTLQNVSESNLAQTTPSIGKVVLGEMVITKKTEPVIIPAQTTQKDIFSQGRDEVLKDVLKKDEIISTSSRGQAEIRNVFSETMSVASRALKSAQTIRRQIGSLAKAQGPSIQAPVSDRLDSDSQTGTLRPWATVARNDSPADAEEDSGRVTKTVGPSVYIMGKLEIFHGLAMTNDHHIEIRRWDEGVLQEKGNVNLSEGSYHLKIKEPTGFILGRLVSKDGQILGEGKVRVSEIRRIHDEIFTGPKIKILPVPGVHGLATNFYKSGSENPAPAQTKAQFLGGSVDMDVEKNGVIASDLLARGSSTLLRTQAPGFYPTQQIIFSGTEFDNTLFPESYISALKKTVSEQRQYNLDDPQMPVIWGQVSQDGVGVEGIRVEIERFEELDVVYFNEFYLPDPQLRTTSKAGTFAILDPPEGFLSLIAKRSDQYYSHANTVVTGGMVSFVKMENTLKTENATVKVFDAFTGEDVSSRLTVQSLSEFVDVDGIYTVTLPVVSRLSFLDAEPKSNQYFQASYYYNDSQAYIHVPMIQKAWIHSLMTQRRVNQDPNKSIVIGFVPEENFDAGLLNYSDYSNENILYFDSRGNLTKERGVSGGGFILFNAPADLLEVGVQGDKSQKILSKVIGVDPGTVHVLDYRSE